MLGKLLKYELLAEYRKYAVLYIGTIAAAIFFLLFDKGLKQLGDWDIIDVFSSLMAMLFVILCIVSLFMVVVFAIVRFNNNLFKDEGYLMHTLPVKPWEHIVSKIIASYIWFILSLIVIAIGISIVTCSFSWISDIIYELRHSFMEEFSGQNEFDIFMQKVVRTMMIYFTVTMILYPAMLLIYIYFCIAVGSLFNGHRTLMAVITFFVVNTVSQVIISVFMFAVGYFSIAANPNVTPIEVMGVFNKLMIFSAVFTLLLYGAMGYFTNYIMSKKLNLE
ncbi:MAG: hypothetical protein ACI4JF_07745 [Oscillospiraceae bacterium]